MKTKVYKGDLVITEDNQHLYTDLTEVSGDIHVYESSTFTAPALTRSGDIFVNESSTFTAPALTRSGDIFVNESSTFTAPALTRSGDIFVNESSTFTAPALTSSGYIRMSENATLTAPALTEVLGDVDIGENATLTAPVLVNSGFIFISENATLNIPQTHGLNYKSVDYILFVIKSEKTLRGIKIYTGYRIENIKDGKPNKRDCFLAEKENFYGYRATVKNAISDLQFKIAGRKVK